MSAQPLSSWCSTWNLWIASAATRALLLGRRVAVWCTVMRVIDVIRSRFASMRRAPHAERGNTVGPAPLTADGGGAVGVVVGAAGGVLAGALAGSSIVRSSASRGFARSAIWLWYHLARRASPMLSARTD